MAFDQRGRVRAHGVEGERQGRVVPQLPLRTEAYKGAARCLWHTTDQWATEPSEAVRGLLLHGLRGRHSTAKAHVCVLITNYALLARRLLLDQSVAQTGTKHYLLSCRP